MRTEKKNITAILAENIAQIRKNTGLNQEKFYGKYLKDHAGGSRTTLNGIQGFMSKMENARVPVPAELLPVYARLAGCTIDDLFREGMRAGTELLPVFTVRDACRLIVALDQQYRLQISAGTPEPANDFDRFVLQENRHIDEQSHQWPLAPVSVTFRPHLVSADPVDPSPADASDDELQICELLNRYAQLRGALPLLDEDIAEDQLRRLLGS